MNTQRIIYILATIVVTIAATQGWLEIETLIVAGSAVALLIFGSERDLIKDRKLQEKEEEIESLNNEVRVLKRNNKNIPS